MKKLSLTLCALLAVAVLSPRNPLLVEVQAQGLPVPGAANANESVADRSRELNKLFNDIWQDKLKHDPEYATSLGESATTPS